MCKVLDAKMSVKDVFVRTTHACEHFMEVIIEALERDYY